MRVLAIADEADKRLWDMLDRRLLEGVDLILSCGDLPAEYLSFLTCFTRAPILYVHGNHDARYEQNPPEGCECAEDKIVNIGGVRVLGLGGSMRYKTGTCMYTEKEMKKRVFRLRRAIRKNGGFDILLAHAPAKGVGDEDDLAHNGFECFLELMKEYRPQVMVHGHVHPSYGIHFQRERAFESTRVINANQRAYFDVEPRTDAVGARGFFRAKAKNGRRFHFLRARTEKDS